MENLGFNLIILIGFTELILLAIIIYRQGIQNKDVLRILDRNNQLFDKAMRTFERSDKNQEKVANSLDRTERYIIESQTHINAKLETIEKKG